MNARKTVAAVALVAAGFGLGAVQTAGAAAPVNPCARHSAAFEPTVEAAALQRVWRQQHGMPWTPGKFNHTSDARRAHFLEEADFVLWAACHPAAKTQLLGNG